MKNNIFPTLPITLVIGLAVSFVAQSQVVDTGDKVGIGINPPLEKLHINGSVRGNGAGGALRISTANGYLDLGPMNTSWAHLQTDRPLFYFNKSIHVDGAISSYSTNDVNLQTNGTTRMTILNSNGYTGIGTSTPSARLHVTHSNARETFRVYLDGNTTNYLSMWQGTGAAVLDPIGTGKLYLGYDMSTDVYISSNGGKVGIGNTNPGYKLDVTGPANDWKARFQGPDGYITIGPANPTWAHIYTDRPNFIFNQNVWSITGGFSSYNTADLALQTNGTTRITVSNATGNVGIGTSAPNQKLTVNGTIYGKEVKVDLSVPGPDYVFEKEYPLPSLAEIKNFIDQHKHLPEIPTAAAMAANGINLSEMNMLLLKKIEEMTLYLINLNENVTQLKLDNRKATNEIEKLKAELNGLKSEK